MENPLEELTSISRMITRGEPVNEVLNRWETFVEGVVDPSALVQLVLRESYLESHEDLQFLADKVRFYNNLKKHIRDERRRVRTVRAEMKQTGTFPEEVTEKTFELEPDGEVAVSEGAEITTADQLDDYIENLEDDLETAGDDAQLANIDLQNMLQKQQQTMQMMSSMSKALHDTAMAVIRKISG